VHGIDPSLVDGRALDVLHTLKRAGHEAYIVGGAVRDLLLGLRPKDFDVATSATPEQVKALFRRAFIIGRRFRLVHVVFGRGREHETIEVTTFRAYLDAAAADPVAPLPQVPVWADELRQSRGLPPEIPTPAAKPKVDPELRARAMAAVREVLVPLEEEIAQGHGKASAGAAQALRQALKEHGRHIDAQLDRQAHAALAAAGELEGWQRWRADQLREELVRKAEGLLNRPEGQALGGRKMQESLRELREQWKQTDQGGVPNHALWKRFDEACNQAYKVVEAWLEKIKTEAAEHKARRLALIGELQAWASAQAAQAPHDWKAFSRELHQFAERWREAGHLSEKAFAELQPQWKAAMAAASAPLDAVQKESLQRRQAMIEEATQLGAAAQLRIDAVKALQQRWQAEAQTVPLERKHEQKLWDAFRKPIDEAFARKSSEREQQAKALNAHDQRVLDAAQALDAASASGDAARIRAAMAELDAAMRSQQADTAAAATPAEAPVAVAEPAAEPAEAAAPAAAPKKLVAMRADDRPGMKKAEPAARDERRGRDSRGGRDDRAGFGARGEARGFERPGREARGPRLGDAAFRAQREAIEHAEAALRKLAAQAHGEVLTQLLTAWEQRDAAQLPAAQALGSRVNAGARGAWVQSLQQAVTAPPAEALLRLEMAAEVPTPADQLDARRTLQLQLLTRRHEAPPAQTWAQDVAQVLAGPFDAAAARRLQAVLKVLLKR